MMKDYHKIIEALTVKFVAASSMKVLQPLTIENFYDVENILMLINGGQISYSQEGKQESGKPGELLFIPSGKPISITYGGADSIHLTNDYFLDNRWKYLQAIPEPVAHTPFESFSYITFDARVFEAINLFTSLSISSFIIKDNNRLSTILKSILTENTAQAVGRDRVLGISTELLVIELLRHMLNKNLVAEKLAANHTYFKDARLINIVSYISRNLGGDLSNSKLASVANVSEDYMGQYFKLLTGISPQDYVEYQRMEQAIKLLRTTSKRISDISKEVGFKDTAYFCRRFKLRFGIQAGKMRSREALLAS